MVRVDHTFQVSCLMLMRKMNSVLEVLKMMEEPIVWQWPQIIYCGVLFLVGFVLGHLTGMQEGLNIVSKKIEDKDNG